MDVYEQIEGAREILEKSRRERHFDIDEWIRSHTDQIKDKFPDVKVMGIGTESLVIENPASEDEVLSFAYDPRKKYGILPFAENFNIHKIIHILYPEDFTKIRQISGISFKNSIRERVHGSKPTEFESLKAIDRSNAIEKELYEAGIDITIDTAEQNYVVDAGKPKNIDFVDGYSGSIKNINLKKVMDLFDKRTESLDSQRKEQLRRALTASILRLQELHTANSVFQEMVEKNDFDIDDNRILEVFGEGGSPEVVHDIKRVLIKAVEAVTKKGYKYDKRWIVEPNIPPYSY